MNKTELIAAVAEKASISKKESEVVINAALDTIIDSLKNDEKLPSSSASALSRPSTALSAPAATPRPRRASPSPLPTAPTFKAGKAFKDAVAE